MPTIRPTVRRFETVAPGGAIVGAGLQDLGQTLGSIANLRTNLELLDLREQEQIEQLEQVQFEKVERSEAIAQFTSKQIARNEMFEQILGEAKRIRSYEDVQKAMEDFEDGFNQELFTGRSQEFINIFESIDLSARVSTINKLGTAIQNGNLGIIKDNYQVAADNFVDSVNAFSDPAEIVDFFDALRGNGVNMGMRPDAVNDVVDRGIRDSMERYVRSLPLVDSLAALSDESVAKALGEDGREGMRRDLIVKANIFKSAQELVNAAFLITNDIDIVDALSQDEDVTVLSGRIRDAEGLSPTEKKDRFDFLEVLLIAREKGPQPVDPEIIQTNVVLSNGLMDRSVAEIKAIRKDISAIKSKKKREKTEEESKARVLEIASEATAVYREAVLKEAKGEFDSSELAKLRFKMESVTEGLVVIQEVAKKGIFDNFLENVIIGPINVMRYRPFSREGDAVDLDPDLRVPNAIIGEKIQEMFLGEGTLGNLSSQDKLSLEAFLVNTAIRVENSSKPLLREEANKIVESVFSEAQKQFLVEEKGVGKKALEQAESLTFGSGEPVTKPRQQTLISRVADSIRGNLALGFTIVEIEEFMQGEPGFTQEAFDRAAATVQVAQ